MPSPLPEWLIWFGLLMLGLLVGSFLNVVAYRLPVMMGLSPAPDKVTAPAGRYNLVVPLSACPHCSHRLRAAENIPILSYILLRGRCSNCGDRISLRYPAIESATALITAGVGVVVGLGWPLIFALPFVWALVCVFVIDLEHMVIPDSITLPLIAGGLLVNAAGMFVPFTDALIGATAGYLFFWLLFHGVRLVAKREALGGGDFKLFAALGAWLGWQQLPIALLIACLIGSVVGGTMIRLGVRDGSHYVPFGPFLAVGGLAAFLWGPRVLRLYWEWLGIF